MFDYCCASAASFSSRAFLAATLDSAQSYSQFQGSLRQTPSAKGRKMDRMPKAARNQQYHREPRMLETLMVVQ